ncbi:MAG: hypothetical protein J7K96_03535 [Desulfobacteraceae bacterium]|nr:hypothetical protein [Desulfobacteraceae bacterium]
MHLIDFIIAEDIRREMGNKVSVMGIFNDDITLNPIPPKWPIPMHIGILIRIRVEDTDQKPDKFSIKISVDGNKVAHMDGEISSTEKIGLLALPLVIKTLPIPGPGILQFDFSLLSGDEILLTEQNGITIKVI